MTAAEAMVENKAAMMTAALTMLECRMEMDKAAGREGRGLLDAAFIPFQATLTRNMIEPCGAHEIAHCSFGNNWATRLPINVHHRPAASQCQSRRIDAQQCLLTLSGTSHRMTSQRL